MVCSVRLRHEAQVFSEKICGEWTEQSHQSKWSWLLNFPDIGLKCNCSTPTCLMLSNKKHTGFFTADLSAMGSCKLHFVILGGMR